MNERFNEGTLEALSSPSRERIYTDFSNEIEVDPISREIWVFGQGDVEWQLASNDAMSTWTVDAASTVSIFVTAKKIQKFGPGTTVTKIIVFD